MNRVWVACRTWGPWLLVPLLLALGMVLNHARGAALLQDSDTKVLLEVIRDRQNPWGWFTQDWPLENHFYRPVSTLVFEYDNWRFGNDAAGYGLTNALLAAFCIGLLFWLARELLDSPWMAGLSATLFAFWLAGSTLPGLAAAALGGAAILVFAGLLRGGFRSKIGSVLLAAGGLSAVAWSLNPIGDDLNMRVVGWIPGRTASVMLVFVLIALAAYTRYERLTAAAPRPVAPSPEDLPATRSTQVVDPGPFPAIWLGLALVATALALGAYEQAVMLPALLTGVAIAFALAFRRRPHWLAHVGFWGLLGGYLFIRSRYVPSEVSGYQAQQFREGPDVFFSMLRIFGPGWDAGSGLLISLSVGPLVFLTSTPWMQLWGVATQGLGAVVAYQDRRAWLILATLLMAFFSYLPMAWLKYFGHYMLWPAAMMSLFVPLLMAAVARWVVSAVAPPPIPAPARPDLAPHSLLHR